MKTIPTVTERTLRSRVGERNFAAGEQYFRGGAIFDARRQGRTLKARCQGSREDAYLVQVTFGDKGIAAAECSCPVGSGGQCKHVAALLLAWRRAPEEFTELEELDAALERRSKPELILLIKQMLRRESDLELLLETPPPGTRSTAANAETYRRQAKAAFRKIGYGWGAAAGIADELRALKESGDHFLQQQDYGGAAAVFEAISAAVREHYDMVQDEYDEDNALGAVLNACIEGLGQCLDRLKNDPNRRELILRELWEAYRFDVEQGGLSMAEKAPDLLAQHTTASERRTLAGWVRAALPRGKEWHDKWRLEEYGGLLLDLEEELLDDTAFLRLCRDTGRRHDLVDRLLQLGRLSEAVAEAEHAADHELIGLADLFVQHRHGEVAERLVQERSQKSKESRLLDWLKKRAAARRDSAAVLELSEKLFRLRPSLSGYQEIRKLAKKRRRWQSLQPELLAFLKQAPDRHVLTQIYLDEGDIDQALAAVKTERGSGYSMKLEVAKAAEKVRPQAALEIYRKQAESLLQHRSRDSYRAACPYLKKVRDLYKALHQDEEWAAYIRRFREQHSSLRALLDELNKARL